jgi:hypothetical protein
MKNCLNCAVYPFCTYLVYAWDGMESESEDKRIYMYNEFLKEDKSELGCNWEMKPTKKQNNVHGETI